MPKLDGFEVLELIDIQAAVVFVTAYDQYAMRALDAGDAAARIEARAFGTERSEAGVTRARRSCGTDRL